MHIKPEKRWFSRKEAAAFLVDIGCPIAPQTLANLATHNNEMRGPPFTRISYKIVRYDRKDLEEWAKAQTVKIK